MAAEILRAVTLAAGQPAGSSAARLAQAAVLAVGAALFLGGDVTIRRQLRLGPVRLRAAAAVVALATMAVGATVGLVAQLVLVAAVLVAPLIAEQGPAGGEPARADAAG